MDRTGSGARVMGKGMSRSKFFWQGCKDGNSWVGFLISRKRIDRVVDVKNLRHYWPMKVQNKIKLNHTEMSTIRRVKLNERKTTVW